MDLLKLTKKNRCVFAIKLAERAASYLYEREYKKNIDKAINYCWEWIWEEKQLGEILYNCLDDEGNGLTIFQEMEEQEKCIYALDCIIDAIAYISKASYEKEGVKYLPEPIEIVDDNIFVHMKDSLLLCDSGEIEYIENEYKKCLVQSL